MFLLNLETRPLHSTTLIVIIFQGATAPAFSTILSVYTDSRSFFSLNHF